MGEPMRREFMTTFDDAPDEPWIACRNPTEREESGCRVCFCKQLQNPIDIGFDSAFSVVPVSAFDVRKEGFDLEIIFHIDCHGVNSWTRPLFDKSLSPTDDGIAFRQVFAHHNLMSGERGTHLGSSELAGFMNCLTAELTRFMMA